MPLIEELPQTKNSKATPGWAYVVEPTSLDPSKAPIIPTARKRTARSGPVAATGELSARQQSKIQQHLASLDRENNKDAQITLPNRPRDITARGLRGKMTPGVKKILSSQKMFTNHLADEEAMIALEQEQTGHGRSLKMPGTKGKRASHGRVDTTADDSMDVDSPILIPEQNADDVDSLLKLHGPIAPTFHEMDELIKAPPLSYNAARAAPSSSSTPSRVFCEICGYWGHARCMRCGARVCGLHCKTQHDETSCAQFWA